MRRKDRAVTQEADLLQILQSCKVCRVAMNTGSYPYIVPMNFGFSYESGTLTLFFHSALEGRKIDLLRADPRVCFEMDCAHSLIISDKACGYGYRFQSIIGEGDMEIVADAEEKMRGLACLMAHQTGRSFTFSPEDVAAVTVLRLRVRQWTGKAHV